MAHYFRGDLTIGANFDDGRGNAVFSVGYQQADPGLSGRARLFRFTTSIDSTSKAQRAVRVRRFPRGCGGRRIGHCGRSIRRPVRWVQPASFLPFNFNPYNIFFTPFERFNMYGAGHYDISDHVTVYTRGLFSKNRVSTVLAPAGVFGESITFNVQQSLPACRGTQPVLHCQRPDRSAVYRGGQCHRAGRSQLPHVQRRRSAVVRSRRGRVITDLYHDDLRLSRWREDELHRHDRPGRHRAAMAKARSISRFTGYLRTSRIRAGVAREPGQWRADV